MSKSQSNSGVELMSLKRSESQRLGTCFRPKRDSRHEAGVLYAEHFWPSVSAAPNIVHVVRFLTQCGPHSTR